MLLYLLQMNLRYSAMFLIPFSILQILHHLVTDMGEPEEGKKTNPIVYHSYIFCKHFEDYMLFLPGM